MNTGTRNVYNSKRPIETLEDLKGLEIPMIGNPLVVDTMNALGGNGVAMGFDQLINAMRTGVVDSAENNEPSHDSGQHDRYAKYGARTGHLMTPELPAFTERTWNSLSKDDQALVAKFSREAQREQRRLWSAHEQESLKRLRENGVVINDVPNKRAFVDAVKPVWDRYATQHKALIERIVAMR